MIKLDAMTKSISIVGTGPSVRWYLYEYCRALKKPTDIVWAINRLGLVIECDAVVAMDDRRWVDNHEHFAGAARAIDDIGVPVYTSELYPEFPSSRRYPLTKVRRWLKQYIDEPERLLDNSVNFALALALTQGYEPIYLHGMDFRAYEHLEEKPSQPWWRVYYNTEVVAVEPGVESFHTLLGIGLGIGRQITLPTGTAATNLDRAPYLYGYGMQ